MKLVSRKDIVTSIPAQLIERDWRERLVDELNIQPDPSPKFDQLIRTYIKNDPAESARLGLDSRLICECMKRGKGGMLSLILAYGQTTTLSIRGKKIDERAWKTLVASMPMHLGIKALKLSDVCLSKSSCTLLFKALDRMADLHSLSLSDVEVETSFLDLPSCPYLPRLETLDVVCVSRKVTVHPLLLKVLGACQLRDVTIEYGESTTDQHKEVAKALDLQTVLNSLKLKIARHDSPDRFECYMPFLCGKKRFVKLDLSGSPIGVSNFNKLLEALSQDEAVPQDAAQIAPRLTTLSLSGCGLGPECKYNYGLTIDIGRVAEIPSLRELDLSSNDLRIETTTLLLTQLAEKKSRLQILSLTGNRTGPGNVTAIASFLRANDTLLKLSCRPGSMHNYTGFTVDVLGQLVHAMESNSRLCQLDIPWDVVPSDQSRQMQEYLNRNRKATLLFAMHGGMRAVLNSYGLNFPDELLNDVYAKGMTPVEAVRLASVNTKTWQQSQEFLPDWRLLK